jgi:hypothetical protein
VDVDLLREVTGIGEDPPVQHGVDRDTTAWHLLQSWLEEHASRRAGVTVRRGTDVIAATAGNRQSQATVVTDHGTDRPATRSRPSRPYRGPAARGSASREAG